MIKRILQASINKFPDLILLRTRSEEVDCYNSLSIHCLIEDLKDTCRSVDIAVGLAAVQIGVPARIFVISTDRLHAADRSAQPCAEEMLVIINPVLVRSSKSTERQMESCLSILNYEGEVKRAKRIKINYKTVDGISKTISAGGLLARVILHEIDHLDGVLYSDKLVAGSSLIPVLMEGWLAVDR